MFKVCQKLCKIILQVLQNFTNLQSCRGSFSAGWRPNFASKYATCSPCRELHAPPAFAPLRVEKFCKRSAKKSTASPKFRQTLTETCNLAGARSRLGRDHILQQNTQRAVLAENYPLPQLLHRSASNDFQKFSKILKIFENLNFWNFRKFWKCRGSFSAGWRPYFATKYATGSSCRELPAPPAFAPLRVQRFWKFSKFFEIFEFFFENFWKFLKILKFWKISKILKISKISKIGKN